MQVRSICLTISYYFSKLVTIPGIILFLLFWINVACFGQHPSEIIFIKTTIKALEDNTKPIFLDSLGKAFRLTDNSNAVKSNVYYQIGYQFDRLELYEKSIPNYRLAARFAEDDNLSAGKALGKLGRDHLWLNRPDSAIHHLLLSASRLNTKDDPKHNKYLSYTYLDLCEAYTDQGDYERATQYAQKAVAQYQKAGDNFLTGFAFNTLASTYYDQKRYDQAIANYTRARQQYQQLPEEDQEVLCDHLEAVSMNLANCYLKKNVLDSALVNYSQFYASTCPDMEEAKLSCKEHMGIIYRKQGAFQKSLSVLQSVLKERNSTLGNSHPDLAGTYDNLGDVYLDKNQYQQAIQQYDKAISQVLTNNRGELDKNNIQYNVVDQHSVHLLTFLLSKSSALKLLFRQNGQKEHLSEALKTLEIADVLIDRMRQEHTAEASKLFWRETTRPIYEQAVDISFLLEEEASAFYFIEKSKAVLLADAVSEQQAAQQAGIPNETIQLIRKYQEEVNQQKTPDIKKQAKLAQLIASLKKEYPAYYQYKYSNRVPSLKEVQSTLLNDTTAVIQYFVGDTTIYSISVTSKTAILVQKTYQATDLKQLDRLSKFTRNPRMFDLYRDTFKQTSQQLFSLLWPTEFDGINRYLILPDAWLHSLNFELLMDGGEFLIKKNTFHYNWSATIANYVSREKQKADHQFLGMAPVTFNPSLSLSTLNFSKKELASVSDLIDGKNLLEEKASYASVMKQLGRSWRILHWSTHAKASDSNSFLALSDSLINIAQIYQWSFPQTELVTLSACETSLGKYYRGEGVSSLARAFIYAGAQSVVASLWEINDESTANLIAAFYGYLKEGQAKDVALRQAKLQLIEQSPNPYHWAGLIALGSSTPIHKMKEPSDSHLLSLGLSSLFIGFLMLLFFIIRTRKLN